MDPWHTPHTFSLIDLALEEDLGRGDVTSLCTVSASSKVQGTIVARQDLVVAGLPLAAQVCLRVSRDIEWTAETEDGQAVSAGTVLARMNGSARAVLAAERTVLNFLQRLSGVATQTARFVLAAGRGARVVDTRKTTPGYRALEKYAVRMGGGSNHRFDLGSGVLIKDNHISAVGSVSEAVARARQGAPHGQKVEVEVDTLEQFDEALAAGADIILLDNFTVDNIKEAVRRARGLADRVPLLEVSGGVTLQTVAAIAQTGIDVISVGALTHSASAVDIALDFAAAPAR